jgi:AAA domain
VFVSAKMLQAAEVLSEPGGVIELRALKHGSTTAGYFSDLESLSREAGKLDGQGATVYVTLNPVKTALFARAENRVKRSLRETTSDKDVLRRRWLLVDADPNLPAGISSTDAEKEEALRLAREVYGYLRGQGWPEPVAGDSGNGAHLLYAIDLPNDAESLALVRGVLEALSFKFSDERVKIDTFVCNAARISKLYGTTARKGDSTDARPHRVSRLLKVPDERVEVSREQLALLAGSKPEAPKPERRSRFGEYGEFDLAAWIGEHGVPVKREGPWQQGYRYILEECPWNGHTDNACYIVRFPSGAIFAGCQHDSCRTGENRWREAREHYQPGAYERRYERNGHGPAPSVQDQHGILLSEVVPERVRWLWDGRIALGKLNLVDGDPGTGKSAATTDLAARVSVGKAWPDGAECKVGGVVLLSAEDGLADTIRPRLDAAGGDPSKAVAVSTVPDAEGNERQISILDDLHVIEAAIERVGAVLVVIDPLMAFLPGEINSHRDQDVRRALAPLARMAERTGAAVVVVRHLNKGSGGNALYRGGGSIGIVGAVRSGLLIANDPEDDSRRVLASIKSNLAAPAPSLVFSLSGARNGAVCVDWKGESPLDASALLSAPTDPEERSVLQEARDLLRDVLSEGPVPASEVKDEARSADISERTLKTAKRELRVLTSREGKAGKSGGGRWIWALPTASAGIKGVKPEDLHPKSGLDRTDVGNRAYQGQEQAARLRVHSEIGVKEADDSCTLNRPLSEDVRTGQSAFLPDLLARRAEMLSADVIGAEARRSKSGPALALGTYLEKPTEERLEWLTRAVLTAREIDPEDWRGHAAAVKAAAEDPTNHPPDCECGAGVCG